MSDVRRILKDDEVLDSALLKRGTWRELFLGDDYGIMLLQFPDLSVITFFFIARQKNTWVVMDRDWKHGKALVEFRGLLGTVLVWLEDNATETQDGWVKR